MSENGDNGHALPNLVVIGAMKCGTSALHYYLSLHPEVQMSSPKELNFFCERAEPDQWVAEPDDTDLRIMRGWEHNWDRGTGWYSRHFDPAAPVRGEASPNYTAPWEPGVARRMSKTVPGAKLIFCVRDPLEMIASQHAHHVAEGHETRTLDAALAKPQNAYVARARFATCVQPFIEQYGRERLLFLEASDLRDNRRETMSEVFEFLGVEPGFWDERMDRLRHQSSDKNRRSLVLTKVRTSGARRLIRHIPEGPKYWIERTVAAGGGEREVPRVSPERAEQIGAILGEDTERLRKLTGLPLEGWAW